MPDFDRDFCEIFYLVLFKCFVHKILVECFPLDSVEGFVHGNLNAAAIAEPLDNMRYERPGQVIVYNLVIRPQVRIDLLFPEHAVRDICIGRCNTGKDPFPDLRPGVVELEFREFPVFFLQLVSPDLCKAPADRKGVMDDKCSDDE